MLLTGTSTRLTIGLSIAGAATFGAYGIFQDATEGTRITRAIEREMELVAKSVQVAVENALRDRQFADVQETLEQLEAIDPKIDILVFDSEAKFKAGSGDPDMTDTSLRRMATMAQAATRMAIQWDVPEFPGHLVASMPLVDDDETRQGGLIVLRPLQDLEHALARAKQNILIAATLLIVVLALVGFWLSTRLVGRPLSALVVAIERLRTQGTADPVSTNAGTEILEVERAFNALLTELQQTRSRLQEESDSRLRLEEGLRRVDKLVTVGQLSAGLAHEIGSPLQILSGRASALATKADDAAFVRKNAAIVVKECDRITHIVEQLLAFARRRAPAMTEIDLTRTVRTVIDIMGVEARRRGVRLSVDRADVPVRIRGDHEQLQQVVINLLSNALVATPKGGTVSLSLQRDDPHDSLAGGASPCVRLMVADTGSGMPRSVVDKLFQPFFTTRSDDGGTGLGLAVVKAIVADHGGRISARSQPDLGSEFTVELPIPAERRECTT
jgi:signal transduction histidine kinase